MAVEIRPARGADVDGIRTVASRAWHAAHAPIVGTEAVEAFLDEHYGADSFRSRIDDDAWTLEVAVGADDGVVGFATASPDEEDETTFHLSQIYVHPDRWGEGIGRRLLQDVERTIRRRGGTRVVLGVVADNERAVGFYETAGYEFEDEFYDEFLETTSHVYEKEL